MRGMHRWLHKLCPCLRWVGCLYIYNECIRLWSVLHMSLMIIYTQLTYTRTHTHTHTHTHARTHTGPQFEVCRIDSSVSRNPSTYALNESGEYISIWPHTLLCKCYTSSAGVWSMEHNGYQQTVTWCVYVVNYDVCVCGGGGGGGHYRQWCWHGDPVSQECPRMCSACMYSGWDGQPGTHPEQ